MIAVLPYYVESNEECKCTKVQFLGTKDDDGNFQPIYVGTTDRDNPILLTLSYLNKKLGTSIEHDENAVLYGGKIAEIVDYAYVDSHFTVLYIDITNHQEDMKKKKNDFIKARYEELIFSDNPLTNQMLLRYLWLKGELDFVEKNIIEERKRNEKLV